MKIALLCLAPLFFWGCSYDEGTDRVGEHATSSRTPTVAEEKEAAQLRKELPQVNEVLTELASVKKAGKSLTPEQIDLLLTKFEAAEARLRVIETRLKEIEAGATTDDHDHDHSDHDH